MSWRIQKYGHILTLANKIKHRILPVDLQSWSLNKASQVTTQVNEKKINLRRIIMIYFFKTDFQYSPIQELEIKFCNRPRRTLTPSQCPFLSIANKSNICLKWGSRMCSSRMSRHTVGRPDSRQYLRHTLFIKKISCLVKSDIFYHLTRRNLLWKMYGILKLWWHHLKFAIIVN